MSAQQPVPPIVAEAVVGPYIDPLPDLRRTIADLEAKGNAIMSAVRLQHRSAPSDKNRTKRARSPPPPAPIVVDSNSGEDEDEDEDEEVEEEQQISDRERKGCVSKRLAAIANEPFSLDNAIRHADALMAVARDMKEALVAEKEERSSALERVDRWAARNSSGFDKAKATHAAALRWFKENLSFERAQEVQEEYDCIVYLKSATLAGAVRIVRYAECREEENEEWTKVAPASDPPPSSDIGEEGMAMWGNPEYSNANTIELDSSSSGAAVMALLPAECPLRNIPSAAVVALMTLTVET